MTDVSNSPEVIVAGSRHQSRMAVERKATIKNYTIEIMELLPEAVM